MKKKCIVQLANLVAACLCTILAISAHGQSYTISTIAGTGAATYSGDGGPATAAELNNPGGVAKDAAGNIYIADRYNNRIRKITPSGTISTIAGNGISTFAGDGGPATAASLNGPMAIAIDGSGNLYIADMNNYAVRKINTSGVITTICGNGTYGNTGDGGPATNALLEGPLGVAVDNAGNIYISDYSDQRVRKIDLAGNINTIAGTGISGYNGDGIPATTAKLNYPTGISVDGSNIYIAEYGSSRVRKIDASGTISTVAGTGVNGYSGDGGQATDAQLAHPWHAVADADGNLYIADASGNNIRKINTSGIISTIAGTGSIGFSGDGGPATAAELHWPSGLATDINGHVYIADQLNNRIRLLTCAPPVEPILGASQVCVGSTITLTDATPDGIWGTSNGTATVSGGVVTGVSPGINTISYSFSNTCGTTVVSKSITINALPPVTAGSGTTICSGSNTALSATGATGYSWAPAMGLSCTNCPDPIATPTITTTYTVTGTMVTDITYSATFTGGLPPTTDQCNSWDLFRASLLSYYPYTGFTIRGSENSTGISCTDPAIATAVANAMRTGTAYTGSSDGQTWYVGLGCSSAPCGPISVELANQGSCSCNPGYSIRPSIVNPNWGGVNGYTCGASSQTIIVEFHVAGTGCSNTDTVTVNVDPLPVVSAGPGVAICSGNNTPLTATGAGTYSWAPADGLSCTNCPDPVASPTTTTTYTVTGTGRTAIVYNQSFVHNVTPGTQCDAWNTFRASLLNTYTYTGFTIRGSENPIGISCTDPAVAAAVAEALRTGTSYYAPSGGQNWFVGIGCHSGAPGCGSIAVELSNQGTCSCSDGYSVRPAINNENWGGVGGHTCNAESQTIEVDFYIVGGSCSSTATVTVTVNPVPATPLPITGIPAVCIGATTTLSDLTPGGTWSSNDDGIATVNTSGVVTGIASGTTTINYTMTNSCGSTSATRTVTVNPMPDAGTITGTSTTCVGASVTLTNAITGGVWSSSNGHATVLGGVVTGVSAGLDTIRYTVANACTTAVATMTMTINPLPDAGTIIGPATVCIGTPVTFGDVAMFGIWSSSTPGIATIDLDGVLTAIAVGTDTIKYRVTNACGTAIATKLVTVNTLPGAGTITGPSAVCIGASITLADTVTGGVWSTTTTNATVSGGVVTGVATGYATIKYIVTNSCGAALAAKVITIDPLPNTGIIWGPSAVCVGSSVMLTDTVSGGTWSSTNGLVTITGGDVTGLTAGTDTIKYTVSSACGTQRFAVKVISIHPLPAPYPLTGSGGYCPGTGGAAIGLLGSQAGTRYQLYHGATPVGGSVTGTGLALDFGRFTDTGIYTVFAWNPTTTCAQNMSGNIRVYIDPVIVPQVAFFAPDGTEIAVGQTIRLTAIVTNGMVAYSYRWFINGELIPGDTTNSFVNTGIMLYNNDTISCLVKGIGPCGEVYGSKSVVISVHDVGVPQVYSGFSDIKVFPNPNKGEFTIQGTTGNTGDEEVHLLITNMLGQVIYRNTVIAENGKINEQVMLSRNFAAGNYLLNVRVGTNNKVFHLVLEQQ